MRVMRQRLEANEEKNRRVLVAMIALKKTKEHMTGLQLVDQTAFAAPVSRSSR